MSGAFFRLLNMGVLIVTTPILVRSLGDASFGIFVTITAFSAYLALSDLGIGASLLTVLGRASAAGDRRLMAGVVVDAAWFLVAAGLVIGSVGLAASALIDIPRLLGAPPGSEQDALAAFRVFVIGFGVTIPLTLGSRVQSALQQGPEVAAWLSLVTALSAVGASIAAAVSASLVVTMSVWALVTCGANLAQTIRVVVQHRWILGYGLRFRSHQAQLLRSVSAWLFVLQIAAVVAFQTDLIIVSALLGADNAAIFHGTMRAFALVSLTTTALAAQFWPAAAEAFGWADDHWVRDTHRRLAWQLPVLSAVAGLLLIAFGQRLIGWWLGQSLVPPLSLLVAFALWTTYAAFVTPYSHVLNAAGVLRPMAVLSLVMAGVNLVLSLALTSLIGVAGPPLGSLVAHVVVLLIPMLVFVRRVWARESNATAGEVAQ